jgi:transposase
VITGTGRRRRFPEDDKARVTEETLVPDVVVSEVACRHGLTPQHLFSWRRRPAATTAETEALRFVPTAVEAQLSERTVRQRDRKRMPNGSNLRDHRGGSTARRDGLAVVRRPRQWRRYCVR